MKHFIFYLAIFILIFSCNNNSSQSVNNSDSVDLSAKEKITEPPQPTRDSISIDISKSSFNCTRSKTVKEVDKVVKLFGADMNVKMDNASFSTDVVIKILNGSWFTIDKKFDGGKIILDMASISTVQVGKNNELEMTSPEYLDVKNYPTATLFIDSLQNVINDPSRQTVVGRLQLKSKTEIVRFQAKTEYGSGIAAPVKLSGDLHINGIEWGLNNKNSKVVKDDLLFHVVLTTKK